jgi:hypothetical protein
MSNVDRGLKKKHLIGIYPLVIYVKIAIENGHRNS